MRCRGTQSTTEALGAPPALTPRERVVLVELCRPLLSANVFTQPASVREIAEVLVVSEAAVKQHLGRLYEKFGVVDDVAGPPGAVGDARTDLVTSRAAPFVTSDVSDLPTMRNWRWSDR
jgi:DNA-binding NarL/FixJ family response regulator